MARDPGSSRDEARLLPALRAGDEATFAQLVDDYGPTLMARRATV